MTARRIAALMNPASVVLVGASDIAGTLGDVVRRNLAGSGFEGPVHFVNLRHASVAGQVTYRNVRDLPEPADLADDRALLGYVHRTVMTGQHISSSARLGFDGDPLAVVDPECRVRGVQGLRVIDSAIMPDSIRANTHATILALAWHMGGRILAGS